MPREVDGGTLRIAGIDIGTNSVRLLVADVAGGELQEVAVGRVVTRLGEGMSGGRLAEAAVRRTLAAVAGFQAEIDALGPAKVVAVATAAVRDACDGAGFVRRMRDALGLEIRVPLGEEEALYSWHGVRSGLARPPGRSPVVMDLGGGSTEFTWLEEGRVTAASVPVGAVRLFEAGGGAGEAAQLLAPTLTRILSRRSGPGCGEQLMLVGVGGTAATAAAMTMGLASYQPGLVHGRELSRSDVRRLAALASGGFPAGRPLPPGLDRDRADIIPAGLAIMVAVLEGLGLDCVVVSERGLLHGLVLHAAGVA